MMKFEDYIRYFIKFIIILLIVMTSTMIGYYGVQLKLWVHDGTFYHDPLMDFNEMLLTMGMISCCTGIVLYILIYENIMNFITTDLKKIFKSKKKQMKGGKHAKHKK